MNSKIYSISAALLLFFSPYALAVNPNPPKVFLLEPGGYGGRLLVKWTQNTTDVEWYAVERLTHPLMPPGIPYISQWSAFHPLVKAREGLGGRDLELVVTFSYASDVPTADYPKGYRVCAVKALPSGRWGVPPDHPKKCSSVTQYPRSYLKKEVDRVSGPSLLAPQASSTLRASPALKTTPSGSTSTSANSQASPPTINNRLKPGDALGAKPRPSPPGAAAINGGGVLQAQPARCPPSCPMPAAAINGSGVLQSQPAPRPTRHICDAARDARARNSPAAPNLEAQCRASGGKP